MEHSWHWGCLELELQPGLVQGHGCQVWIIQQESHYGEIVGIFFSS